MVLSGIETVPPRVKRRTYGARSLRVQRFVSPLVMWCVLGALIVIPVACFLALATSPRLFQQGPEWFTLKYIGQAFSGSTAQGIINSLWVSLTAGVLCVAVALGLAWAIHRTTLKGRRFWSTCVWGLLLIPTWVMTLGWQDLLQPFGGLSYLGIPNLWLYNLLMGPVGIVMILTFAGVPFGYFVISASLRGLGQEYEDAARTHGASRWLSFKTIIPMVMPALVSAFAICFAETMSDFGVAFTLGYHAHFPLATYTLFSAIDNFPANFSVGAVIAIVLVASAIVPIVIQSRMMRGRNFAVLSGRNRQIRPRPLSARGQVMTTTAVGLFFAMALGVPLFGAFLGSFTKNLGSFANGGIQFTLDYYRQVLHPSIVDKGLGAPLLLSNKLALIVATVAVMLGMVLARQMLVRSRGISAKITDLVLLGSIAVPGVVLGIGYIFSYNLPFVTNNIVNIYKTLPLLMLALIASALPAQTRFVAAPLSQLQPSLSDAARVHGASRFGAWRASQLPLLSRVLIWAWLLTFARTISELAIAQILYPPGTEPASVAIQAYLANFEDGTGTAMTMVTLLEMVGVILVVIALFRLLAPKGWRRIGWSLSERTS